MVGLDNHGQPSGHDVESLLKFEPADITSKIHKYTGINFEVEIHDLQKQGKTIAAVLMPSVSIPIVFSKPGTYDSGAGKQKTAFGIGTVYFRHGAKSEPGTTEDVRLAIQRQLESIRKEWVQGIRKVTTAPVGSKIVVAAGDVVESRSGTATPIRITTDPKAPAYRKLSFDETHPYRLKALLKKLNETYGFPRPVSTHDMLCLRRLFSLDSDKRFCHKPTFGSQQYSDALIEWFAKKVSIDPDFLNNCRKQCHDTRYELGLTAKPKKKN
jgi:hypothetical protein